MARGQADVVQPGVGESPSYSKSLDRVSLCDCVGNGLRRNCWRRPTFSQRERVAEGLLRAELRCEARDVALVRARWEGTSSDLCVPRNLAAVHRAGSKGR
jgi:hypothetical protein